MVCTTTALYYQLNVCWWSLRSCWIPIFRNMYVLLQCFIPTKQRESKSDKLLIPECLNSKSHKRAAVNGQSLRILCIPANMYNQFLSIFLQIATLIQKFSNDSNERRISPTFSVFGTKKNNKKKNPHSFHCRTCYSFLRRWDDASVTPILLILESYVEKLTGVPKSQKRWLAGPFGAPAVPPPTHIGTAATSTPKRLVLTLNSSSMQPALKGSIGTWIMQFLSFSLLLIHLFLIKNNTTTQKCKNKTP